MGDNDLLYAAIIAGVAFYAYKQFKNVGYSAPMNKYELAQRIDNAGGTVTTTSTGTYYNIPGGVIKLPEQTQLRRWESALIAIDRVAPGDFLTRYALS